MKKENKNVAIIKLYAPKGETMIWKTSISHIDGNKVKDLKVAKRNFAHYLVNKYWLLSGKAIKLSYADASFIRPIASNREELYKRKEEMRIEIDSLSEQIIAKKVRYIKKKKSSFDNYGHYLS